MALSILDGNQSATTLSTIVTSGQHIPAHTVVSLGTQAISNITSAVSGSSVTFGLVGGTVTANNFTLTNVLQYDGSHYFLKVGGVATTGGTSFPVYVAGSVTVGNTVTIGSLPAISGTVTAQLNYVAGSAVGVDGGGNDLAGLRLGYNSESAQEFRIISETNGLPIQGTVTANVAGNLNNTIEFYDESNPQYVVAVHIKDLAGNVIGTSVAPMPISGTVTIGAGTSQIGSVTVGNSVTIGSLPSLVAGAANIGVVTIGNIRRGGDNALSQLSTEAGSNYLQTVVMPGTSQIGSVTVGNSVTIGSLPAISGTVTANTFAVQGTAVTTSNFTSTTDSTVLANFNATREVLTIFNEGAGNLHICAGATCTTIAYQVRLSAGDYYEGPNHQTTITHSAVFATAGTARVTEVS
jgi:hypothetical protein